MIDESDGALTLLTDCAAGVLGESFRPIDIPINPRPPWQFRCGKVVVAQPAHDSFPALGFGVNPGLPSHKPTLRFVDDHRAHCLPQLVGMDGLDQAAVRPS